MRGRPAGRSSPDPAGEPAARLAAAIERRGLAAPAALILDAHRPLVPLLGAAAAFVRPLLGPLGAGTPRDAIELLEDPDGLDRLLAALDPAPDSPDRRCRTSAT